MREFSLEHKEKLRIKRLAWWSNPDNRKHMSVVHIGQKVSKSTKIKLSISNRGKKHWNWMGDSPVYINKNYSNTRWKDLRLNILKRDNWTCQNIDCGKNYRNGKKRLHVHHIIPYKKTKDNSESNLITLCISCHKSKYDRKK